MITMIKEVIARVWGKIPTQKKVILYHRIYQQGPKNDLFTTLIWGVRLLFPQRRLSWQSTTRPLGVDYAHQTVRLLSASQMISLLKKYEVLSFDIFDTLVLRTVKTPVEIFVLMGQKLGILDFAQTRQAAEQLARQRRMKQLGNNEVTIAEIYDFFSKEFGYPAKELIQLEIATELENCVPNPEMHLVYQAACQENKTIVITSDMYLPKEYMMPILSQCGIGLYHTLYISCEQRKSKHTGELFDVLRETFSSDATIIHVGDNFRSDVMQAHRHGISSIHIIS